MAGPAIAIFRRLIRRAGREKERIGGIGEDSAGTNAWNTTGELQMTLFGPEEPRNHEIRRRMGGIVLKMPSKVFPDRKRKEIISALSPKFGLRCWYCGMSK